MTDFWAFARANYGWHVGALTGAGAGVAVIWAHTQGWLPWWWLCAASPLVVVGGIGGLMVQLGRERLRGRTA